MDKKITVLIVEDEASAIFALERYFEKNGYNVLKAFSAHEGLRIALEKHPDVMILDVVMPITSGLDVLPELREDTWGKNAKVLVFSNLSGEEYKARAQKYYVDGYYIKTDVSLKDLEDGLKKALSAHGDNTSNN